MSPLRSLPEPDKLARPSTTTLGRGRLFRAIPREGDRRDSLGTLWVDGWRNPPDPENRRRGSRQPASTGSPRIPAMLPSPTGGESAMVRVLRSTGAVDRCPVEDMALGKRGHPPPYEEIQDLKGLSTVSAVEGATYCAYLYREISHNPHNLCTMRAGCSRSTGTRWTASRAPASGARTRPHLHISAN